ncbi:MAG TPA: flagellar motor protein MotD [Gammaproteobacteria bacterium]|nr:flagellar motor protein MotD [Gammaproteobacteria bacterium]
MARKKRHEEHVNHERWLVSYADFITLLFAFFVVMYAISSVNEGKYRVLSDALVSAFRSAPKTIEPIQVGNPAKSPATQTQDQRHKPMIMLPPLPQALTPESNNQSKNHQEMDPAPPAGMAANVAQPPGAQAQPGTQAQLGTQAQPGNSGPPNTPAGRQAPPANDLGHLNPAETMTKIADDIAKAMAPLVEKDLIAIRHDKRWIEVEIKASVLYSSGSARLEQPALPILGKLAEILSPFPNTIHVEGFTDNKPIRTLTFPSNWELSAARAASVVHLFSQSGINPERMLAVGHGEYQAVADNATEEGRSKNRRVVLIILADDKSDAILKSQDGLINAIKLPAQPGRSADRPAEPAVTMPEVKQPAQRSIQANPGQASETQNTLVAESPPKLPINSAAEKAAPPPLLTASPEPPPAPSEAEAITSAAPSAAEPVVSSATEPSAAPADAATTETEKVAETPTLAAPPVDPNAPIDVMSREQTERGTFSVIAPPITRPPEIPVRMVAPPKPRAVTPPDDLSAPVDVMNKEVTDRGSFVVIPPPIEISPATVVPAPRPAPRIETIIPDAAQVFRLEGDAP